jgi:hypothetical protein
MIMAVHVHPDSDTGVGSLMSGIVDDVQELIKQEASLFKHELRADIRHAVGAVALMAIGGVVALFGILLLCFMLAYLINFLAPSIPLWGSFAIVGAVMLLIGLVMAGIGHEKLRSSTLFPRETVATFKENWNGSRNRSNQATHRGDA